MTSGFSARCVFERVIAPRETRNLSSARVFSTKWSRATATSKRSPGVAIDFSKSLPDIFYPSVSMLLVLNPFSSIRFPSKKGKISRSSSSRGGLWLWLWLETEQRRDDFSRILKARKRREARGDAERSVHVSRREKSDGELPWNEFRWHSRLDCRRRLPLHCLRFVTTSYYAYNFTRFNVKMEIRWEILGHVFFYYRID